MLAFVNTTSLVLSTLIMIAFFVILPICGVLWLRFLITKTAEAKKDARMVTKITGSIVLGYIGILLLNFLVNFIVNLF